MVENKYASRRKTLSDSSKRQTVYNIIHHLHQIRTHMLAEQAQQESIDKTELKQIMSELRNKGLIYSPKPGHVVCVDP